MQRASSRPPMFVYLLGVAGLAMLLPTMVAYGQNDVHSGQMYLQGALLMGLFTALATLATRRPGRSETVQEQLLTLLAAYTVLPLVLAVPHQQAIGSASLPGAWFEMISAMTTTGAVIYDDPTNVPLASHIWRATVGWLGGLLAWVSAVAVLAPLNLGGFEVRSPVVKSTLVTGTDPLVGSVDPMARLVRFARLLTPVYASLTLAIWILLITSGESQIIALGHAMSALSTSGFSPIGGIANSTGGFAAEAVILLALLFALSRTTFAQIQLGDERMSVWTDPEIRLGLLLILGVTGMLFARHWLAVSEGTALSANWLAALWGMLFTAASFLTTSGFVSNAWQAATDWSGLGSAGMALMGVAIFGGGVATTAGGVKLLRIYALSRHMRRELQRLVLPSSVGGEGSAARRMRKQGATVAWMVFMLFALSIAVIMTLLTLTGVGFEDAMVLSIAALTTCGPLAAVAEQTPLMFSDVPAGGQVILAVAMVMGRLESLSLVALLNLELWRR